jgi:RNA polymerase sigma factor (sigma-70 family)
MTSAPIAEVLRYIRVVAGSENGGDESDPELLRRFVDHRDEGAFAALLERHGPLVLGVCRRVLGDPHAAEDAFQATFLILARKANSICKQESLAAWLHRVALNLARTAVAGTARRRTHERQAALRTQPARTDDFALVDWQPLLHEEVDRLPQKYRTPVVLCYFEGKTHAEAARALGWPLGTVKGRLARARDLLRARLARRGITLSAACFAAILTPDVQATVPAALPVSTLKAVLLLWSGEDARDVVSPRVAALVEGADRGSFGGTRTAWAALVMGLGLVAAGLALAPYPTRALPPPAAQQTNTPKPDRVGMDLQGDPLPEGALARLGTVRWRRPVDLWSGVFAPDGKLVDTKPLPAGATPALSSGAFSPDGKLLATGGFGEVCFWEIATGRLLRRAAARLPGVWAQVPPQEVSSVAFAPDGKTVAAITAGWVLRYEVASGKRLAAPPHPVIAPPMGEGRREKGSFVFVSFVPGVGKLVLGTGCGFVTLWDATTTTAVREWSVGRQAPGSRRAWTYALSPDGKALFASDRRSVWWLDPQTLKELKKVYELKVPGGIPLGEEEDSISRVACSPGGKLLAIRETATVRLLDPSSGKSLRTLGDSVCDFAFSSDDKRLATLDNSHVRVWDITTGKLLRAFPVSYHDAFLAFAPDGRVLAVANRRTVCLWDVTTGAAVDQAPGHQDYVHALAVAPDGRTVASAGWGSVLAWDLSGGRRPVAFGEPRQRHPTYFVTVAFSGDGKTLAAGSWDTTLRVWDVTSRKLLHRLDLGSHQRSVALFPDGKRLVATVRGPQNEPSVRLFDLSGEAAEVGRVQVPPTGEPPFVTLSPDGRCLLAAGRGSLYELDASGTQVRQFTLPADHEVLSPLVFSPDERSFAEVGQRGRAGGDCEGEVRLWERATGKVRRQLPDNRALCAALSADGRTVAVGGGDGTVRVEEVYTGRELGRFKGHQGPVTALAFTPDACKLISAGADTTLLVWDVTRLSGKGAVRPKVADAAKLDAAWEGLANPDTEAAFRAMGQLLVADPDKVVALLAERLRPVKAVDREHVRRLLADLDDSSFRVRQRASEELEGLSASITGHLEEALAGKPSPEARRRLVQVLSRRAHATFRTLRAVEVLEVMGSAEAMRLLRSLAAGAPGALLTHEAARSVARLSARASPR